MESVRKRIALVYDWVDKWGGAEQIVLALHDLFPDAPLYTLFYNPKKALWAHKLTVKTSFLQKLSFLPRQILIVLAPLAFESLDFSDYDLVISITSHFAKGIITAPNTTHYCICLTPPRYLYLKPDNYQVFPLFKPFERMIKKYLIYWDNIASNRPDKIFAISKTVQTRILNSYNLNSEILYPPVQTPKLVHLKKSDFFIYLGRLESYKNPILITEVFNHLGLPLIIAGTGSLLKQIKAIAKPNIQVLGEITEEKKWELLARAKALIFYHEEDFGIVPVEAMAMGTPVIGLNYGGVSETVINNRTGILLDDFSRKSLAHAIMKYHSDRYILSDLLSQASKFSYESFIRTCAMWG